MGRGDSNILFNSSPIKKGKEERGFVGPNLFRAEKSFSLPAQARETFLGDDHLLLFDARNHLLFFHKEDGGYSLEDRGHVGAYVEEGNYAGGNFAALKEEDEAVSLLFSPEIRNGGDMLEATSFLGESPQFYRVQAVERGAYIYDRSNGLIASCLWGSPPDWDSNPVWSEEEESVLAFSPGDHGALYFQKYSGGPLRLRYLDEQGDDYEISSRWEKEMFIENSIAHTKKGDKLYFTYQVYGKSGSGVYPLYWSSIASDEGERITYLRERTARLEPLEDSLLVFYENGEVDLVDSEGNITEVDLESGSDHRLIVDKLVFFQPDDYRRSLSIYSLDKE